MGDIQTLFSKKGANIIDSLPLFNLLVAQRTNICWELESNLCTLVLVRDYKVEQAKNHNHKSIIYINLVC